MAKNNKWLTEEEMETLTKPERKLLKKVRKDSGTTAQMVLDELEERTEHDAQDEEAEEVEEVEASESGADASDEEVHPKIEEDVWVGFVPSVLDGDGSDEAQTVSANADIILNICAQILRDMGECLNTRQKAVNMRKLTTRLGQVGKDFRTATLAYQKANK